MTARARRAALGAAFLAALLWTPPGTAGAIDWYRGAGVAVVECGGCHVVRRNAGRQADRAAPSIPAISRSCRWLARPLQRFVTGPHALRIGKALDGASAEELVVWIRSLGPIEALGSSRFGAEPAVRRALPENCF